MVIHPGNGILFNAKNEAISQAMRSWIYPVKAMVFPVVMYGCESWTVKTAEHRRIDAFELWCWRRLLRVPWTVRRSNQSILKEISTGCSLEGMILKLKLQYFGHLMRRVDSLEKTLIPEILVVPREKTPTGAAPRLSQGVPWEGQDLVDIADGLKT